MAFGRGVAMLVCIAGTVWHIAVAEEIKEEKASPAAVAIGATLLGAVSFMMTLFYFTNHPDNDMKKYSYEVISQTISIFCAVLLFQATNDVVEYCFNLDAEPMLFQLLVDLSQFLFWYATLQIVLAIFSGALDEYGYTPENPDVARLNCECFAVLLAHMTGFACINAFGTMQQLDIFRYSWWTSALAVPIAMKLLFKLDMYTAGVREYVMLSDDGMKDSFEELWDEETKEAENDVMGLTVSFLSVQSIKYGISGYLANQEGMEPWAVMKVHGWGQSAYLYLASVGFAASTIIFRYVVASESAGAEEELEMPDKADGENGEGEASKRKNEVLSVVLGMSFAWSNFYAVKWYLAGFDVIHNEAMLLAAILALLLTFSSFGTIWCLDKLADAEWTPKAIDDAIIFFIQSVGTLVGFSWEQCFDHATATLSLLNPYPNTTRMLLAVFCGAIIVPAWRFWLLPMAASEGWKFGFVISVHEADKWSQIIKDSRFKTMVTSVEHASKSFRRMSAAPRRSLTENDAHSATHVAHSQGSHSCVAAPQLRADNNQEDIEELRLRNRNMEAAIAETLESFALNIDNMEKKMYKIKQKMEADASTFSNIAG